MLDNVQHVVLDTTICWASSYLLLLLDSNYDKSASNLRGFRSPCTVWFCKLLLTNRVFCILSPNGSHRYNRVVHALPISCYLFSLDTTICWASSYLLLLLDSNYDKSASNLRGFRSPCTVWFCKLLLTNRVFCILSPNGSHRYNRVVHALPISCYLFSL